MTKYFSIDDYFSNLELAVYERAIEKFSPGVNNTPESGPFANQLISNYINIITDVDSIELTKSKFSTLFDNFEKNYKISCLARVELYLPWDIHNDLHLHKCAPGFRPLYNFLVPLANVESRTIVFDQYSHEYNDFYTYKKLHKPVNHPIDAQIWEENLSMCWPEDRNYLSLNVIMPYQRRGQLHAIAREQFHSSDNFHTRGIKSKSFMQIWLDVRTY